MWTYKRMPRLLRFLYCVRLRYVAWPAPVATSLQLDWQSSLLRREYEIGRSFHAADHFDEGRVVAGLLDALAIARTTGTTAEKLLVAKDGRARLSLAAQRLRLSLVAQRLISERWASSIIVGRTTSVIVVGRATSVCIVDRHQHNASIVRLPIDASVATFSWKVCTQRDAIRHLTARET